ncbi:MAG TPA: AsmA-like C-terminal region-containing protein, partial [Myxococcota bacterium]|nr:AsmA-like C-terminal region-containing protein [Myxococcota bacterium]
SQERMSYRLALDSDGAESNTLLSAFTAAKNQLYGPLFVDTDLAGKTDDPGLESLTGRVQFAVHPGKIKDVSLLQLTIEKLGTFGEAALLAAALDKPSRMKKLERYYGDEFRELAGTFDVARGWARTNDLRLVYDGYRVDLAGGLRLRDLGLDFAGTLTFDKEVDEALAGSASTPVEPERRTIELASIKGTVSDPKVNLSSKAVRSWVAGYSRAKYQDKIDEKLGKELGGDVGDLVEGIFGKKR